MSKTTKEDRQRTCDAYPNSYWVRAIVDDLEAAGAEIAGLKELLKSGCLLLEDNEVKDSRIAELEAEIARLREQTQWRPIETAPKDGSLILGWDNKVMRGKGAACVMLWARNEHTQKHEWMNFSNAYRVDNPRYWMPLPQPPQTQESESE